MTADLTSMPAWEVADRARRDANLCSDPKCRQPFPNHLAACERPSHPGAVRCGCGLIKGSLGCLMAEHEEAAA